MRIASPSPVSTSIENKIWEDDDDDEQIDDVQEEPKERITFEYREDFSDGQYGDFCRTEEIEKEAETLLSLLTTSDSTTLAALGYRFHHSFTRDKIDFYFSCIHVIVGFKATKYSCFKFHQRFVPGGLPGGQDSATFAVADFPSVEIEDVFRAALDLDFVFKLLTQPRYHLLVSEF
ncbi:MAG: hypothetical protein WBB28_01730 [Crinalium sp.]